ncbi:MAG TPA: response regulator [Rudaea sp.]|jgi:CheY-like chemotaxis protein|nr:response regulator [Rudaea sp.]
MNPMTRPAHILLVEDRRMDVELTLDAFREARLSNTVQVAYTGEQALDYLFGRGAFADPDKRQVPDLILLDLKLPGVSGQEVLRQVKSAPDLKRIPVVVLTSSREDRDRIESYDNGVNSFLVKPITFDGFMEVVKQVDNYWLSLNVPPPAD